MTLAGILRCQKSEVPEKTKEYVRHVQTKFGKTPKKIRSDRGGEYTAERLQTFLKDEGIQAELTTPYTRQQNGCAERKNRSLVEMTRCMLNDSGLPKKFLGEAIMTANHLQNRLPVDGKETTPYEGWSKRKPDLSYVKEFGSVAYVSIPTEKRQKLDDKARKLVFVGYEKETQCDGDLFEDQLSEADEENATSSLIENHPEREITDQNLEITAPEENT